MKDLVRIVIDTNVLVSALRSRAGWSFELISQIGLGRFQHVVTVPLAIEYEDVLHRAHLVSLPAAVVDDILDYVCFSGLRQKVHFLWRPKLPDIKDDMVLEAAVNGQCRFIVTWNLRDFSAAADLGIRVLSPKEFLTSMKEHKP